MHELQLNSAHLLLAPPLATPLFGQDQRVFVSYKETQKVLLVSSSSNSWFPKLHQASTQILKIKDLKGTRSLAINDLLIDHDIDPQNRVLAYEANQEKKFIKIMLD